MDLKRLVAVGLLLVAVCGCGGQSSIEETLGSVISTYNGAHPHNLAGTGAACERAANDLLKKHDVLTRQPSNGRDAAAIDALKRAFRLGQEGFARCHSAARTLNYPLMAVAIRQIEDANAWIERARRLVH